MKKKCKGCGVELQYEDKEKLGYSPKEDADYCQRCFRLTHYNDPMISMQKGIDNDDLLNKVSKLDALVLWVVDLFDLEGSIIEGIHRHLVGKDIIMVCTKRDILPLDINNEKLINFINNRLNEYGINILGIILVGDLVNGGKQDYNYSIDEIENAIDSYRYNRDVVVIGTANAGKSTLLNAFLATNRLTVSAHPGTSIDLNPIQMDGYVLYDTPGLVKQKSLLTHINDKYLKYVIPTKTIRPKQFQLVGNQSLAIGGLVRFDFFDCSKVSVLCYFSPALDIHRGKIENADDLWFNHFNELLFPVISSSFSEMKKYALTKKEDNKIDIVIPGLGWICLSGDVKKIDVYVDKKIDVIYRKAMI